MALTIDTKTFNLDAYLNTDAVRYAGPNQSYSARDHLDLSRSFPKPNETFAGMAKFRAKFTRTLTDGTDVLGDAIVDIIVKLPSGSASAEVTDLVTDVASFVGGSDFSNGVTTLDVIK